MTNIDDTIRNFMKFKKIFLIFFLLNVYAVQLSARDAHLKPGIASNTISSQASQPKKIKTDSKPSKKKKSDVPIKLTKADKRKRKRDKPKKLTIKEMDFDQLKEMKDVRIAENDLHGAILYAEKLIPMCKDMHELKDLTLELANLLFKNGDKQKAGKLYAEFVKLYPGSDEVAEANYQAIVCSTAEILEPTRDQTATKETLELTEKFLARADVFDNHIDEVIAVQKKCYEVLFNSEMGIIDFYLKKGKLVAVENRLKGLRNDFIPKLNTLEPRVMTMEIELAFKQNNLELATQKLALLHEKYPNMTYQSANVVVAQTPKRSMADRF